MKGLDLSRLSPAHRKKVENLMRRANQHQRPRADKVDAISAGIQYDSKLEAHFSQYVEALARSGSLLPDGCLVVDWDYHPMRVNLTPGLSYTPDFGLLVCRNGSAPRWRLVEVKGSWKSKNARDSRVRLEVAAQLFPFFEWVAVVQERGAWIFETIGQNAKPPPSGSRVTVC